MNRRTFCFQLAASAVCVVTVARKGLAQLATRSTPATENPDRDVYAIWSLLIPILQCSCAPRGFMIDQRTAVPRFFLTLGTSPLKTPILTMLRLSDGAQHPEIGYEAAVPKEWQSAFMEAIAEAKRRKAETVLVERRLVLPKRYRVLTPEQIQAFYSLSPHVAPYPNWRPDPTLVRKYKGWNFISAVSVPYFDSSHRLALVWADTSGGGCAQEGWYFFTCSEKSWVQQKWDTIRLVTCA